MLSLNHEQQQPKAGTTSVSQMCKIRHSMTEGSQLFSFKTITKCCLLPKGLVSKSKECACNILPTLSLKGNEPDGLQIEGKSWQIETPFFRLVKRAARPSLNRM